jgi:dihydrodipicolinate synthase/N-acetylneuraminate lyase
MLDPQTLLRPRRRITGMSAILLPFQADGAIDWPAFQAHVARTAAAGLTPAVNMDTGYVNLLDPATRRAVLAATRSTLGGTPFVAGAFVGDRPGAAFRLDDYRRAADAIQEHGGTPVVFQSYGLTALQGDALLDAYRALGRDCPRFLAFELGTAFAPFGRIYDLDTYAGLLAIPQCVGAKHSSLHRVPEWQRLALRDRLRPDFLVLTGNDLAIDMVMYGSDYLLGLSTFAPDVFARRDALWAAGDPAFHELNDLLQYLGFLAFRPPVPAYKHSAAQFLKLRGWIATDATHPDSPHRPDSDRDILRDLAERLAAY